MDDDLVSVPDDGEPAPEPPKAEPEVAKNGVSKRPGGVTGKGFLPGHGLSGEASEGGGEVVGEVHVSI